AHDLVAALGQAGAGHQADVAGAHHRDLHTIRLQYASVSSSVCCRSWRGAQPVSARSFAALTRTAGVSARRKRSVRRRTVTSPPARAPSRSSTVCIEYDAPLPTL